MQELIATKRRNRLLSIYRILISSLLVFHLSGCGGHVYHVVEPGETLYSIGWMYGYDYRQIAQWNDIGSPYALRRGQRLRVAPVSDDISSSNKKASLHSSRVSVSRVSAKQSTTQAHKPQGSSAVDDKKVGSRHNSHNSHKKGYNNKDKKGSQKTVKHGPQNEYDQNKKVVWKWPVKGGKVIQTFNENDPARKGLDLIGHDGQAIFSAAAGRVVYSGGGLPRYGKLLIIKHSDVYLSAYAYNKRLRVKEGENIKVGQHIADMGRNGANKIKLHFEIRRNGKPTNPLIYLPHRKQ